MAPPSVAGAMAFCAELVERLFPDVLLHAYSFSLLWAGGGGPDGNDLVGGVHYRGTVHGVDFDQGGTVRDVGRAAGV